MVIKSFNFLNWHYPKKKKKNSYVWELNIHSSSPGNLWSLELKILLDTLNVVLQKSFVSKYVSSFSSVSHEQ